jgi:hypothetical protein
MSMKIEDTLIQETFTGFLRDALLKNQMSSGFIQIAIEIPTQCAMAFCVVGFPGYRDGTGEVACLHIRQVSKLEM